MSQLEKNASLQRRMVFATSYLPPDIPGYWSIVASFANQVVSRDSSVTPESAKVAMENMRVFYNEAFFSDAILTQQLIAMEYSVTKQPLGVPLVPLETKCSLCGGKLLLRADRPSLMTLYTDSMGTIPATHFHKFCHNYRKGCHYVQFYGYSKSGTGTLRYNSNWKTQPYFLSSQETGFEMKMLHNFDIELLIGQISYKQKADIYNVAKGYDTNKKECATTEKSKEPCKPPVHGAHQRRQQMDRRRFEAAHLKYACFQMAARYPEVLSIASIQVESCVLETLSVITPTLFKSFEDRYAEHTCSFPGCGSVFVLDGNMKNQRDVCFAKDAGFIQFGGLPGSIKTGCPATPAFMSRYCPQHKPQACTLLNSHHVDEDLGVPSGPALRSRQSTQKPGQPVAEMILGKKSTRKQTYYQVLWLGQPECYATWEPAISLPQALIQQFEDGVVTETSLQSEAQYGHVSNTLTVAQRKSDSPDPKRMRLERPCHEDLEGTFKELTNEVSVTCRTEKDHGVRLNYRSAGVLAGIWPCGVVVLLRELYIAESKAQVYGHLHEFLKDHPDTAQSLKFICYDDGCHLRKYATNRCRSELTPTSKILSHLKIVVDKMHMAGHVDVWCKKTCDPHLYPELEKVDTEVCEQTFSWLSRYSKMTHKMSRHVYIFFLLYLCDLHNEREIQKLQRGRFL